MRKKKEELNFLFPFSKERERAPLVGIGGGPKIVLCLTQGGSAGEKEKREGRTTTSHKGGGKSIFVQLKHCKGRKRLIAVGEERGNWKKRPNLQTGTLKRERGFSLRWLDGSP